jgi:alkaline phosphatase D
VLRFEDGELIVDGQLAQAAALSAWDTGCVQMSRRRFLALSATVTIAACSRTDEAAQPTAPAPTDPPPTESPATTTSTTSTSAPPTTSTIPVESAVELVTLDTDPFIFGVASGDPDTTSAVVWTRLGGELPNDPIEVTWAWTEAGITTEGSAVTNASLGHSVHVEIPMTGPGTYEFRAGGFTSPRGAAAPINPDATSFRIATASCQHFETGHYAAHRDIAEWAPDLVLFLGDFIYEGDPIDTTADGAAPTVRAHEGPEPTDLDGYRARYATYLADPHLQASRAAAPWLTIWDDHEVENNYAALTSEVDADPDQNPAVFAERRAAAYRAWWENTPTRLAPPDADPDATYVIYRGIDVGDLVRISALDGRQFRDDQVSDVTLDPGPPADGWDAPDRTMLGAAQEAWLDDRFSTSTAIWNCLAQQTILSDTRLAGSGAILNYDQWDGYSPARDRVLASAPPNLITVTGDIHLAGVGVTGALDTPRGIEFVTTAVSSVANVDPALRELVLTIPAIVDAELKSRGYTRHTISPNDWTAEFRQVVDVLDADSGVTTWKTFRVEAGVTAVDEV